MQSSCSSVVLVLVIGLTGILSHLASRPLATIDHETPQIIPTQTLVNTEPTANPTPWWQPTARVLDPVAAGSVLENGELVLCILGWQEVAGGAAYQPAHGMRYIIADVAVANRGNETVFFNSSNQVAVIRRDGRLYEANSEVTALSFDSGIVSNIMPGEMMRGTVGFEIPENITDWLFEIQWETGNVVDIQPADGGLFIDLPRDFPGQAILTPLPYDQPVELADFRMSIQGIEVIKESRNYPPLPNSYYVVVALRLENLGDKERNISSLLQYDLKDANGYMYGVGIFASLAGGGITAEGTIPAGGVLTGKVGFMVPDDSSRLALRYVDDILTGEAVFITLPEE